jgi:hypothetical protein
MFGKAMRPYRYLGALMLISIGCTARAGVEDLEVPAGQHFVIEYPDTFGCEPMPLSDARGIQSGLFPEGRDLRIGISLYPKESTSNPQITFGAVIFGGYQGCKLNYWGDIDGFLKVLGGRVRSQMDVVEKEVAPVHYKVKDAIGSYTVFTDPHLVGIEHLEPGQMRYLIVGVIRRGNFVILVRGYANSTGSDDFARTNQILEAIKVPNQPSEPTPTSRDG